MSPVGVRNVVRPCQRGNDPPNSFFFQNKFTSLSLAFKTDKLTLSNRLELQQRQRDTAERNIEDEIEALKNAIGGLNRACADSDSRELIQHLQQQVDVLRHSAERVSSSAEVYGAVQQEARISRAIEVMMLHVENIKRIYEREHAELEDAKK
jgi:tRNA A37 N6-isopentenylltransferase MiaA